MGIFGEAKEYVITYNGLHIHIEKMTMHKDNFKDLFITGLLSKKRPETNSPHTQHRTP